ncbi:fork head domain-containing protein [Trichophaea hybrida]|nr:fork head domain-containing protein [Trichophaea hybrida]
MAATRSAPAPMTIHQDVLGPFSQTSPSPSPTTNNSAVPETTTSSRPSSSASSNKPLRPSSGNLQSIMFRPPVVGPSASPSKRKQQQKQNSVPKAVFENSFDRISMPPPDQDAFTTDSPMKKPPVTVFDTSIPIPSLQRRHSTALFTQFQASKAMAEKENFGHMDGKMQKAGGGIRRVLMEAAPIKEKKVLKEKSRNTASTPDPDTWQPSVIVDDGKKPPYSYATLIGMAILRASNRRLTLAQIYKWIGDSFQYYRTSNNGWQNSIRHNLSLNKAFVKQERPKDDPGKGNYWVIQKGCEQQFMKSKNSRKSGAGSKKASSSSSPPISSPTDKLPPSSDDTVKPKKPIPEIEIHVDCDLPAPTPTQSEHKGSTDTIEDIVGNDVIEELLQLSSDATRSAGSVSPEPSRRMPEDDDIFRPSSPHHNSSPPPIMKRKLSSMNDSGYFSSLESSAIRPSNIDEKPRIKRGRAEEDIARIRHPQHESPTRRSTLAPSSSMLGTSSPLRSYDINPMLPPLTPATTLRPQKPPRSVSPNTNLRLHRDSIRQLVTRTCFGSPERGVSERGLYDTELFGEGFFPAPDLFGVDVFGLVKNGFERFTNDCPESPTAGVGRPGLYKSHTTRF